MITCQRVVEAFPPLLQQPHASRCLRFVTVSIAFPLAQVRRKSSHPPAIWRRFLPVIRNRCLLLRELLPTVNSQKTRGTSPAARFAREEIARRDSE